MYTPEEQLELFIIPKPYISDADIGWLGGIIDGEGYIGIRKLVRSTTDSFSLVPCIIIANTNTNILQSIKDILTKLHIVYNVYIRNYTTKKSIQCIHIGGITRICNLLSILKPAIYGKQQQAELMIEFCKYAQNRRGNKPYEFQELELFNLLGLSNKRGIKKNLIDNISIYPISMNDMIKGYIAGLIDGEGHLGISRKNTKKKTVLSPTASLVNTNVKIISIYCSILKSISVKYCIVFRKPREKWANCSVVKIFSQTFISQFISFILPNLRGKREQAELLNEFCNSKQRRRGYTDRDLDIYYKLRKI